MMNEEPTVDVADNMFGDKLYQQRAQLALPLLVRQARMGKPMYYQNLADELGMPNARNLNFVLGSVGTTLNELAADWDEKIPPVQSLVINQGSGQPGPGFFGGEDAFHKLSKRQREAVLEAQRVEIYAYSKWDEVLAALKLKPVTSDIETVIERARNQRGGAGESEDHKRLKEAIAADPSKIWVPKSAKLVAFEYPLPSGDRLDLLLEYRQTQYAVEVKSKRSSVEDIARGLFQCVKYQAVLDAWRAFQQQNIDIEVVLAIEPELPAELLPLKNALQIEVVHSITLPEKAD